MHARWESGGCEASGIAESWSDPLDIGHGSADGENAVQACCIATRTSLCCGK